MFLTTPEFVPQRREQRVRTLTIIESARAAGHDSIIAICENCDEGEVVFGGRQPHSIASADNSHHVAAATARRTAEARRRAENALLALRGSGESASVTRLAKEAGVSRSWLYAQPDLIAVLRHLAGQAPTPRSTPASGQSLRVRLAAAQTRNERLQHRVSALTEQNNQQRRQLERAYAELRRLQVMKPTTGTKV